MPYLPIEIVLTVIEAFAPSNADAFLSPESEETKTLINFARVSSGTYPSAMKILRRHCANLDTRARAKAFAICLDNSPPPFLRHRPDTGHGWKGIENLFVACFPSGDGFDSTQEIVTSELQARLDTVEPVPGLIDINEVEDPTASPVDDLTTSLALLKILGATGPTMKRLVIDVDFRSLWDISDKKGIKQVLWRGLEALEHLEEFTSVRDDVLLYAFVSENHPHFNIWPKLRRLALYNLDFSTRYMIPFGELQHLELFVSSRTDGLDEGIDLVQASYGQGTEPEMLPSFVARVRMLHLDIGEIEYYPQMETDYLGSLNIAAKSLPAPIEYGTDMSVWPTSPGDLVQDWVLNRSLEGTLWQECLTTSVATSDSLH